MKTPKIKECPCCGVELQRLGDFGTVEPACEQVEKEGGVLVNAVLFWKCLRCGCRWKHGQFGE